MTTLSLDQLFYRGLQYQKVKNFKQAIYYYKRAALKHHCASEYNLSYIYTVSIKNDELAMYYLKQAANHDLPQAMNNLALFYLKGHTYLQKDEVLAVEWLLEAAKQGLPKAIYNLANCYYQGTGVIQDETTAFALYEIAAKYNDQTAIKMLAWLYQSGKITHQDDIKSTELINRLENDKEKFELLKLISKGYANKSAEKLLAQYQHNL